MGCRQYTPSSNATTLESKKSVQEWLKGMGLELQGAKTRFAHTLERKEECNGNVGFDFLGFTIRQYQQFPLIALLSLSLGATA